MNDQCLISNPDPDIIKVLLVEESPRDVRLILDMLEHVEYPRKAIEEAHRILGPDGIIVISSVMCFPIHDYPHDYWRFTPEAFTNLLKDFGTSVVYTAGEASFPHTVVGVGFKGGISDETLERFRARMRKARPLRTDWIGLATLLTPPILWKARATRATPTVRP